MNDSVILLWCSLFRDGGWLSFGMLGASSDASCLTHAVPFSCFETHCIRSAVEAVDLGQSVLCAGYTHDAVPVVIGWRVVVKAFVCVCVLCFRGDLLELVL